MLLPTCKCGKAHNCLSSTVRFIFYKAGSKVPRRVTYPKGNSSRSLCILFFGLKVINSIMWTKRRVCQNVVNDAIDIKQQKLDRNPLKCSHTHSTIKPSLEVKPAGRRCYYQVPIEVRPDRRQTLGLRC
jgi:hypothetical protein